MAKNGKKKAQFVWNETKLKAAAALAKGDKTDEGILPDLGVSKRTLSRWKKHPDFQRKVDEIIADIDIAMKSERIQIAKKVIKQKLQNESDLSSKDLLDWLKYVGEEVGDYEPTQKIKHDISLSEKIKKYNELFEER